MSAPPERRVHSAFARLRRERRQHFLDQDRHVLPRRRPPALAQPARELGVLSGASSLYFSPNRRGCVPR